MRTIAIRSGFLPARSLVLRDRQRPHQVPQVHPCLRCQVAGPILVLLQPRPGERVVMHETGDPVLRDLKIRYSLSSPQYDRISDAGGDGLKGRVESLFLGHHRKGQVE